MIGFPTVDDVREWAGVTVASVSDDDLEQILTAEADIQARTLRLPADPDPDTGTEATYPAALARALMRRVQRHVAARQLPLGMIGDPGADYGAAYLRTDDPEIRRLENTYRIPVVS